MLSWIAGQSLALVVTSSVAGFMLSCADHTPAPMSAQQAPASVMIDATRLRALDSRSARVGDRVSVAVNGSGAAPVAHSMVSVADTTVIFIDATGTVHALRGGSTWVRWTIGNSRDSVYVIARASPSMLMGRGQNAPQPPRTTVDVRWPSAMSLAARGRRWPVPRGGDLQAALNRASSGDEILLARGAEFTGNFVLPPKTGSGWVVLRADSIATPAGVRVDSSMVAGMPRVITPNADAAIRAGAGARR